MNESHFNCPNCGGLVKTGALSCPECGSDKQTGWSADTLYDDLDLPIPPGVNEPSQKHSLLKGRMAKRIALTVIFIFILFAMNHYGWFFHF